MKPFRHFVCQLVAFCLLAAELSSSAPSAFVNSTANAQLQNLVTWDGDSIRVHGERIMFFSGEVHPFRLPVPGTWLDIFQKLRAGGFSGASFYLMWGLLEGQPGHVRTEGVFALEEFFQAASEAGIYLLARPGPYINAEVSGGGFPGWVQRLKGTIRTNDSEFTESTMAYLSHVGGIIAKAQITNGGPVILVQPENEYSICSTYASGNITGCLQPDYMEFIESQLRNAGVTVPFISNDGVPIFGGTNWGNLGHAKGYTSYDVGAAISENRAIDREKYSELKLQGYFFQSSPSYLESSPDNGTFGKFTDSRKVVVTQLKSTKTAYYIVRQADHTARVPNFYSLAIPTSKGKLTVPRLGGQLILNGRDSKIHVVDYPVGNANLVYSTAEVMAWRRFKSRTVLILYGGDGETHEFAVEHEHECPESSGGNRFRCRSIDSLLTINWDVQPEGQVLRFSSGLEVHLLWRKDAYNYWILDLPAPAPINNYTSFSRLESTNSSVIIKAGYLMRTARMSEGALFLTGDVNRTTEVNIVGAPVIPTKLYYNGQRVHTTGKGSQISSLIEYRDPKILLPDLSSLEWRYLDTLPEVHTGYDDSKWVPCTNMHTNNTRTLTTPSSLYASDYGFHSGSLLYRGHFTATGHESSLLISTQGGEGFGHSIWLNSTFLGSWPGQTGVLSRNQTFSFPGKLQAHKPYVVTVLIDHMGLHDNWFSDAQEMKEPRGILDYKLSGHTRKSDISWKLTGNLGGEHYRDHSRGPLNEGSLYVERKGFHLPGAPTGKWEKTKLNGLSQAGIGCFATTFNLDFPLGYDIPISLGIKNTTMPAENNDVGRKAVANFRIQIFVNGWQLGKYGKIQIL
ncbi:putative beta-galactosidase E [Fusarium oxysporum f. sp. cepae]|nr:putative beta-galactosidase E [Fusarium oxysporum f. sp. cepae]